MALVKGANDTKRLNANIDKGLHQDFQIACLKRGEDMTTVLTNFMVKYVELSKQKENSK